jgi:adenosylhomocysteine nucleosidase
MNPGPLKVVCFAVKEEARFFQRLAGVRPEVRVLLTGMGCRNAERAVRSFLGSARPGLVVSAGFAGGLKPGLGRGTVLFSDAREVALEKRLLAAGAKRGRFHFARHVVAHATEKKRLYDETGADAVEMESQIIGAICREHQVPCVTVRVVLDEVEEDLPLDFNELLTTDERMDLGKLAWTVLKKPGLIPALLKLRNQSEMVARRLGEVLGRVVVEPEVR